MSYDVSCLATYMYFLFNRKDWTLKYEYLSHHWTWLTKNFPIRESEYNRISDESKLYNLRPVGAKNPLNTRSANLHLWSSSITSSSSLIDVYTCVSSSQSHINTVSGRQSKTTKIPTLTFLSTLTTKIDFSSWIIIGYKYSAQTNKSHFIKMSLIHLQQRTCNIQVECKDLSKECSSLSQSDCHRQLSIFLTLQLVCNNFQVWQMKQMKSRAGLWLV